MISVIICSINEQLRQKVELNISNTIGCKFEILTYDNRSHQIGICSAYNTLAKEAKGDFLCFCHEDVEFLTKRWGVYLSEFANQNDVGVIGFAGAGSMFGYAYWNDAISHLGHCFQGTKNGEVLFRHPGIPFSGDFAQALVIDGLCLFCKKEVWEAYPFDDTLFQGFHMYDMDFCMATAQQYNNYVSYNVELIHHSQGNMDKAFFIELEKFNKKWKKSLPLSITSFTKQEWLYLIKNGLKNTIKDLFTCTDFSSLQIFCYALKSLQIKNLSFIWTAVRYTLKMRKNVKK